VLGVDGWRDMSILNLDDFLGECRSQEKNKTDDDHKA